VFVPVLEVLDGKEPPPVVARRLALVCRVRGSGFRAQGSGFMV
jgi:hypothetical protein